MTPVATPGGNTNERDAPISFSSWEDIATRLKSVPYFTTPKPPASGVNAFFPFTRHHFVELRSDPRLAGVVHPFHGTLESVLQCTYLMQKYIAEETMEVVRFAISLPKST